ncbi:MAG: alanine--tRNA ligase [Alphaproteobacteria bacterium]|nr:alanine--tRNA ligase [Alphaproteobacteria bacterium]MDE2336082.1 alanine--tRNA ligase [Alphaproteobacteria bacterium]
MTTANQVRRTFLEFFRKNGHEIVPSSSLVPANDPTLMFTNAGMVQFKNVFTGVETRPYTRATTAQKCVRAGGKHNDLDNVGFTARHHTFFEMLGNFSFGDYFKEAAIPYAWELLTKDFGFSKDRLMVTVYHDDDAAAAIWKKVTGFPDSKIVRIPTMDNFWMMGDTGPCGPCSEIFYDHGDKIPGGPPGSPDQDGDRFIEIWNNVFMQFEQQPGGTRIPLPKPSIDTGMGLERLAAILQGKHDNYDVDMIRALIEASANLTSRDPDGEFKVSHRVIADHLRASAFLIADGVLPSNEGRGYVLRRIMRRAMRHAHLLGAVEPLMHRLVPALNAQMAGAYPELKEAEGLITETLKQEELRFRKTLEHGLHLLEAETRKLGMNEKLPGEVAFKLYDTFGFPLDLTQDVLKREQSREVDVAGFEAAMERQREQARKSWKGSGEAATETVWFDIKDKNGATEFLGYDKEQAEGKILALVNAKGEVVKTAGAGEVVSVIVNQTPFYAESGGQVGDTGVIKTATADIEITDTQKKLGGLFVHVGKVAKGRVSVGDDAHLQIDVARRNDIRANHSATHLLHAALHRHVGKNVVQKGSRVDESRLRFDISQNTPLTEQQTAVVESEVNARIRANSEVTTRLLQIDDAKALGAMAMFGEKYDDEVRVLSMGGKDGDHPFSIELCGGTHVRRTGDIGLFKIVSESALAAGVRRVEAVTGRGALAYFNEQDQRLQGIAASLKTSPAEAQARIEALVNDKKRLEKEVSDLRRKLATGGSAESEAKVIKGVNFTSRVLEGVPANELKPMADELKAKLGSGVVALLSVGEDSKASLVVAVTPDLTAKINAVNLVKAGVEKLGGKGGGGRPDMAQGGGPDGAQANDAVTAIEAILAG